MLALSEFDTLEEAKAHVAYNLLSADMMRFYLRKNNLYSILKALAESDETASVVIDTLKAQGEFNFDPSSSAGAGNLSSFGDLIAANSDYADAMNQLKVDVIDHCSYCPYASITTLQFNKAKGISAESEEFPWPSNNILKLSVSGCEEKCTPTVWGKSDDYEEWQNVGRTHYAKSKFVIDLSGVTKYESLKVSVPFENAVIEVV